MRNLIAVAVLLFCSIPAMASDVSGIWAMSLETPNGSVPASLTLKQDGDKVSGTYKGPRNEAPATGTLTDNNLKLSVVIGMAGQSVTLVITAKVDGDKMAGSLDFSGRAANFTAAKTP